MMQEILVETCFDQNFLQDPNIVNDPVYQPLRKRP